MALLSWLTRPTTRTTATKLRTTLSVNQLEAREVPAAGLLGHFNANAAAHANPNALAHANPHAAMISPLPTTQSSSISGLIQLNAGAGAVSPWFATTVSLSLNGVVVQTVTANPDGSYQFTVSLDQPATYTLTARMADGSSLYVAAPVSVTLLPGQQLTGQNLVFLPNG